MVLPEEILTGEDTVYVKVLPLIEVLPLPIPLASTTTLPPLIVPDGNVMSIFPIVAVVPVLNIIS